MPVTMDEARSVADRLAEIRRNKAAANGTHPALVDPDDSIAGLDEPPKLGRPRDPNSVRSRTVAAARELAGGDEGAVTFSALAERTGATGPNDRKKLSVTISQLRGEGRFPWAVVKASATPKREPDLREIFEAPPPVAAPAPVVSSPRRGPASESIADTIARVDELFDALDPAARSVAVAYLRRRFREDASCGSA